MGAVIQNKMDGWYYYAEVTDDGNVVTSGYVVGESEQKSRDAVKSLMQLNDKKWDDHVYRLQHGTESPVVAKTATFDYTMEPDSLYVILVQFQDVTHDTTYTRADFDSLLFASDYSQSPDGETAYGSLSRYYYDMSGETWGWKAASPTRIQPVL